MGFLNINNKSHENYSISSSPDNPIIRLQKG
jgi:hypothetical protein